MTVEHYVYTLAYPESMGGHVFYVGKGQGNRIDDHEKEARTGKPDNPYKVNVIKKIWSNGEQIVKTKLAYFDTHQEACMYEIALIFFLPGLTNLTNGGDGVSGLKHTRPRSQEHKDKIANALKGRKFSEETRKRISEAKKGSVPSNTGKAHSKETRQKISRVLKVSPRNQEVRHKISEARKGKPLPEKQRQKLKNANVGRKHSQETRRKISEANKGRTYTPLSEEARRKMSESRKGRARSEETRRRISEGQKGRVSANKGKKFTPEHRRKISESNKGKVHSEETRRKISESQQRRLAQKREQALQSMRIPMIAISSDASWKNGLTAHSLWEDIA